MNVRKFLLFSGVLLGFAAMPVSSAFAQNKPATIKGHAQNPVGQPIAEGGVFAVTRGGDIKTSRFTAQTDANGDYTMTVDPGSYSFVLQDKNQKGTAKVADQTEIVDVKSGDTLTQNFDLSRQAYIDKLSPEEKKAIEEYKAKNAATTASNAVALKLNEVLKEERADRANKQYDQAATLATQITQGKPQEAIGWLELGIDQYMLNKFDDALPNLQKSVELNSANPKPNAEIARVANTYLGDVSAQKGKGDDAVKYYGLAAAADPTKAGSIYTNGAVIAYNKQQFDATAMLADKAIAADPKYAQAYYLKGQALVQKVTLDPKTNKAVMPPGCEEAYKKYLELDPNGPHAAEVASIIQGLGGTVPTTYRAGKK